MSQVPTALLRSHVTVEDFAGSGAFGPSLGDPRVMRASVQPTTRVVMNADGRTIRADVVLIFRRADGPIRPESRIRLAGVGSWRVIECAPIPDAVRPDHYEALCATWGSVTPAPASGSGS